MLGILIGNTKDLLPHNNLLHVFHVCQRIHDSPTPPTPTLKVAALQLQHHHNLLSLFSTDGPTDAKLHNTTLVLPLYNSSITIICFFCSPKIDRRKAPQSNTGVACNLQILAGVCLQSTNPKSVPGLANSLKLFGRSIEGQKAITLRRPTSTCVKTDISKFTKFYSQQRKETKNSIPSFTSVSRSEQTARIHTVDARKDAFLGKGIQLKSDRSQSAHTTRTRGSSLLVYSMMLPRALFTLENPPTTSADKTRLPAGERVERSSVFRSLPACLRPCVCEEILCGRFPCEEGEQLLDSLKGLQFRS